jgi:hypothetical protein
MLGRMLMRVYDLSYLCNRLVVLKMVNSNYKCRHRRVDVKLGNQAGDNNMVCDERADVACIYRINIIYYHLLIK